ncbi:DUF5641 domain-containing protein [Trichonephila clavipes]|nr:DUF5641 domain-containing protein [Trichonephila clavipes]
MKCLLQDLWKEEIQWDDPLPTHIEKEWKNGLAYKTLSRWPTETVECCTTKILAFERRSIARKTVHQCVTGFKCRPIIPSQIMGGLWEAGVKSVKPHLKRVTGNLHFTFEEFGTIMIQVEGILNSRPLTPLRSDADNFDVLSPGHFLIGRPITSIPEPNLIDVNENRLSRWEKISKVVQCTWKKWKSDFLNTLQARSKWITEKK